MNVIDRNTLSFRSGGAPDELDVMLRKFFRAEMPHPWPALKAPVPAASFPTAKAPTKSRWAPVRSRLALAASVGFLMVGSWCLSAKLPDYGAVSQEQTTGSGSANSRERLRGLKGPVAPSKNIKSEGCCPSCGKDGK